MSLLVILISLALEKFLPALSRLRSLSWITHYQQWIHARLANHPKWQGVPSLLIIILLPVIGTALIQYYLNDLLALFSFVFSIIVLTYCLGPEDEHRRVNDYLDAVEDENRSDKDSIQTNLSEILQAGGITSDAAAMDEETRISRLIESVLIITHDRMLAILFWFVVLGPMGAILYRLTLALLQHEQRSENNNNDYDSDDFLNAIKRLHYLLSWVPGHLTALSYAVMGSFVHALRAWQKCPFRIIIGSKEKSTEETTEEMTEKSTATESEAISNTKPENHRLLLCIGKAALQFDTKPPQDNNAVRETLGLCGRSLVAWITILAIMTLAGWAS